MKTCVTAHAAKSKPHFVISRSLSVCVSCSSGSSSPPLASTSHIHYCVALAQSALFPSVVLNYSVFLGQALVSSYCNDFLIICLYVMNEMEMYHHGQTGAGVVPSCHTTAWADGSREASHKKTNNGKNGTASSLSKKMEAAAEGGPMHLFNEQMSLGEQAVLVEFAVMKPQSRLDYFSNNTKENAPRFVFNLHIQEEGLKVKAASQQHSGTASDHSASKQIISASTLSSWRSATNQRIWWIDPCLREFACASVHRQVSTSVIAQAHRCVSDSDAACQACSSFRLAWSSQPQPSSHSWDRTQTAITTLVSLCLSFSHLPSPCPSSLAIGV
ncbi:unnamed protein product [Pleuronectes platessa]|uniref:Uncharacterized protein n=1 Tax=Pleuronectes platessa TaxID=8262 RepID=A0A9N7YYC9_PLEPL|nr:unnamed protein product [Pleuronectes platessa]